MFTQPYVVTLDSLDSDTDASEDEGHVVEPTAELQTNSGPSTAQSAHFSAAAHIFSRTVSSGLAAIPGTDCGRGIS